MIPKIIHYCWFGGGKMSKLQLKCIESWKKFCPDYEIKEWNEKNYDVRKVPYIEEAYEAEKMAFVSDYARLDIVQEYGGIYLDTDVEIIKEIDHLLEHSCFLAAEKDGVVATGLGFGAEKGHPCIKKMLEQYEGAHFKLGKDVYDTLPCPHRNTEPLKKMGYSDKSEIQVINDAVIYPPEYFCPLSYDTGIMNITEKTLTIHHYNASWISEEERCIEEEMEQYSKKHSAFWCFVHKNFYEYKITYHTKSIKTFGEFLWIKIKKKVLQSHRRI